MFMYYMKINISVWYKSRRDVMITHTGHLQLQTVQNNLNCQTYLSSKDLGFVTWLHLPICEGHHLFPKLCVLILTTQPVTPLAVFNI